MEEFFRLRADKQQHIVDAALTVFGQNTYRKASMNDIATTAGISKAMVFYYFGSKKSLYLYLARLCGELFTKAYEEQFDPTVTDLFDRIRILAEIEMSVIRHHPSMWSFLSNLYRETDPEVADEIRPMVGTGVSGTWTTLLDGADLSRFADPSAPEILARLLTWAAEGMATADLRTASGGMADFVESLALLKKHFYTNT